jgi:hypothetical protein
MVPHKKDENTAPEATAKPETSKPAGGVHCASSIHVNLPVKKVGIPMLDLY